MEETLAGKPQAREVVERIAVPHQIYDWKKTPEDRPKAHELQWRNREMLEGAFAHGLAVVGYQRDGEGNGNFLLGPWDYAAEGTRSYDAKRQ